MPHAVDPEKFKAAAARFRSFFGELARGFLEREDLLVQIMLALLSREHVLMTGPPGTAKSQVARAVLGRIVDERTGEPSLYARQFTESTVQTDLIGPINFKTLMETGHTEHFTEEGMLGAVHAFLDEVLDGRDMLLRSVLNVLQERELKQGTRVTKGAIECAIMTTNRYLAEVLEGSRETLLAFVDRIAFVNFVPKGFADPQNLALVLRRQIGEGGARGLEGVLTIQDLDTLQAAADGVMVSDSACTALAQLLAELDAEMTAAGRADPSFIPTRYLSTRTAVRAARILRAACVFDRITHDDARIFQVNRDDFQLLRLHLVLGGPSPAAAAQLLARETDPRERRQLGIVRTEREIFERCVAKLPALEAPRSTSVDVDKLAKIGIDAVTRADKLILLSVSKALARLVDDGTAGSSAAARVLDDLHGSLHGRAVRAGLTAGAVVDLRDGVNELAAIATDLEEVSGGGRSVARWLRGRAVLLVEEAVSLMPATDAQTIDRLLHGASGSELIALADARLEDLEQYATARARLRAGGADVLDEEAGGTRWARVLSRAEDELASLWDFIFLRAVAEALAVVVDGNLRKLFRQLGDAFDVLDRAGARLLALGCAENRLKARVVGPRLRILVAAAFGRLTDVDRTTILVSVETLVKELEAAGLEGALRPADVVAFAAGTLLRTESAVTTVDPDPYVYYRSLRPSAAAVPMAYSLVEVAMRAAPALARTTSPADAERAVAAVMAELPAQLRASIVDAELGALERVVGHLESWWQLVAEKDVAAADHAPRAQLFTVLRDEGALGRLALEARLLGETFPERLADVRALRLRIEALELETTASVDALLRQRADRAWGALLGDVRPSLGASPSKLGKAASRST